MVNLLMRMNERLLQTEKSLEVALQQKQGEVASQPPETAPIHAIAPPTVTTAVLPTEQPSTVGTSTSVTTITTTVTAGPDTNLSMEDMMKEIKALELQMAELKEAKDKLAKIEVSYDKSKIIVVEKPEKLRPWRKE